MNDSVLHFRDRKATDDPDQVWKYVKRNETNQDPKVRPRTGCERYPVTKTTKDKILETQDQGSSKDKPKSKSRFVDILRNRFHSKPTKRRSRSKSPRKDSKPSKK